MSGCLGALQDALTSAALARQRPGAHQQAASLWAALLASPCTADSLLQLAASGPSLAPALDACHHPLPVSSHGLTCHLQLWL